ncbi:MAG TPA: hypothetical protein VLV55_08480 [Rhizomicrobium sp.]|nr:hypothetical protein [Rhizomicrobium sp.]
MHIFSKSVLLASAILALAMFAPAGAAPLTVVNVDSSDVTCTFDLSCAVTVTDTFGPYPPSSGYSGHPKLWTRTFVGGAGSQADGLTAFEYQADFTHAHAQTDINCAIDVTVRTGPITQLNYDGSGNADVYVITTGALGTIGLSSAVRSGAHVTFTFTTPICPKNGTAPGQLSFYFGFASPNSPVKGHAQSSLTFGGGTVNVPARVPAH